MTSVCQLPTSIMLCKFTIKQCLLFQHLGLGSASSDVISTIVIMKQNETIKPMYVNRLTLHEGTLMKTISSQVKSEPRLARLIKSYTVLQSFVYK